MNKLLTTAMFPKMLTLGKRTIDNIGINFFLFLLIVLPNQTFSWGFAAHKQINNAAVFTLPPELFKFYKLYINDITENAVNADVRRYIVATEACHHYLDADHYEKKIPLDTIPQRWDSAVIKFTRDTLNAYGIGPWNLQWIKRKLSLAFEKKDLNLILKLSADLGHYAADLHVPLHSTENYNGQLTGQEGIHALWESRIYELFAMEYNFFVGRAVYLSDVNASVWQRFSQSFAALDSVLLFEKLASNKFHDKFMIKTKGRTTIKNYTTEFCDYYHYLLNGMVERRARASIEFIGSLWLTAWVDAGQPDLSQIEDNRGAPNDNLPVPIIKQIIETGKMIGRRED